MCFVDPTKTRCIVFLLMDQEDPNLLLVEMIHIISKEFFRIKLIFKYIYIYSKPSKLKLKHDFVTSRNPIPFCFQIAYAAHIGNCAIPIAEISQPMPINGIAIANKSF